MKNYNYDMRNQIKETAKNRLDCLTWIVGATIPAETQDDKTEKYSIIAAFMYPYEAEIFIDNMPEETRNRFFITRLENR